MVENKILLDIDGNEGEPRFMCSPAEQEKVRDRVDYVLRTVFPGRKSEINIYDSPGGNGLHVIATVWDRWAFADWTICMVQLLCGDDWKRSMFNFRRLRHGGKNWNLLFETPRIPVKVEECETREGC